MDYDAPKGIDSIMRHSAVYSTEDTDDQDIINTNFTENRNDQSAPVEDDFAGDEAYDADPEDAELSDEAEAEAAALQAMEAEAEMEDTESEDEE